MEVSFETAQEWYGVAWQIYQWQREVSYHLVKGILILLGLVPHCYIDWYQTVKTRQGMPGRLVRHRQVGWWTNTPGRATGFSHRWPLNSGDQPSPLLVLSWQPCYLLCSLIPFDKEGCVRDSCRVIRIFKLNQPNLLKVPSPLSMAQSVQLNIVG